jgi:hypothetical protein
MWRNRDFVRYWVRHTVSQLGSEVTGLTIGLVRAVGSVGFLVGATASHRLGQRLGIGPVICLGGILTGPGIGVIAAAPRALPILHTVALVRLRDGAATRAYAARRRAEGKSPREIRRCVKRAIARQLFKLLCRYDRLDVAVVRAG